MNPIGSNIVFQGRTEAIYKVIVIGDPDVGKTELLTKFTTGAFEEKYLPTVGVNILKEIINLDDLNATINLMFWDVPGQPQFYMLHRPYFNGADGMILSFDITRSSTFSNVNNWYSTAIKYGLSGIPRILVGIKKELNSEEERKIILPMAEHLSEKLDAPYFEVCLATGENINLVLQKIAELIYTREQEFQPHSKPPHQVLLGRATTMSTGQLFPYKEVDYKLKIIDEHKNEKELQQEVIDKKEVRLAVKKIISVMEEENINELGIERKYLPEIFSLNLLGISKSDGLPKLKPSVQYHFELWGIKVRYYGNVVNFLRFLVFYR